MKLLHQSPEIISGKINSLSVQQPFNEMLDNEKGAYRPAYSKYGKWINKQDTKQLLKRSREAEHFFRRTGITFSVYGSEENKERLIPFDVIPRILSSREWNKLERGLKQRVTAINSFLHDIYHKQEILKSGRIPTELVSENSAFVTKMIGFNPPAKIYTHVVGVDIIRTEKNEFYVLEDNARVPSGVSYMLENRETMLQMFPELFSQIPVQEVSDYPEILRRCLSASAPKLNENSLSIAVLTPGINNSAYFEHSFLADQMGAELVEGEDLRIVDGRVAMRTTKGYEPIDVLYRRIDDEFLDPLNFNPKSLLGVAGLMDVYRAGRITLANAPGTGIADDKAVYSFMPDIIEFYTGEKPLLQNVQTWRCGDKESLNYVLNNIQDLVVKETHGSGGYGLLVGPAASKAEIQRFCKKLKANPGKYIAQPTLSLSTVPILTKGGLAPRHTDLRPFVLMSPGRIDVSPGGLTRVAMKEGSLVVNSSQGGGTKDTWVLDD